MMMMKHGHFDPHLPVAPAECEVVVIPLMLHPGHFNWCQLDACSHRRNGHKGLCWRWAGYYRPMQLEIRQTRWATDIELKQHMYRTLGLSLCSRHAILVILPWSEHGPACGFHTLRLLLVGQCTTLSQGYLPGACM